MTHRSERDITKQIRIRGRVLSVCTQTDCTNVVIWDYDACWTHLGKAERITLRTRLARAVEAGEDLSGIVLTGADLRKFDFRGAKLTEAFLSKCDLRKSTFAEADLAGAFFAVADLREADLLRANLDGAVFTGAKLEGVELVAYSIKFGRTPVNLTSACFGGRGLLSRARVREDESHAAAATYRALKAYFTSEGDYDSASWASFSERLMQRRDLWRRRQIGAWLGSLIFGLLSGYGERPVRAFTASVVFVVLYACLYSTSGAVVVPTGEANISDALSYSVATFTGFSLPEATLKAESVWRIVATSEAFVGMFLFGVFIFTLTKRYVAR